MSSAQNKKQQNVKKTGQQKLMERKERNRKNMERMKKRHANRKEKPLEPNCVTCKHKWCGKNIVFTGGQVRKCEPLKNSYGHCCWCWENKGSKGLCKYCNHKFCGKVLGEYGGNDMLCGGSSCCACGKHQNPFRSAYTYDD